ncbi:2-oxoglutarate and iron-dependent oxygenase domain-containing protein [Mesorhizobium sp. VK25A]|uniref:2-oxoglutarate and iron-dependent oxygenase domain-containing protein n=1 Tax=Mesorhizobium vachelliae TaxID=3072309 RepID=A0ABU5AEZ5_9HYPH|nr:MULTISPECIES: 2-oxoglutarate and iron-dependent oxygenase domain-containing protein [unclassified Mesorhizobium]MDX8535857.1 2-oxoglutarate and iron-dependent oxygenase domain-containing protein [Mesorhizobium sp. VK25D]MDX8548600.1 2-oxoglutarate and iron-dependent oxygenase domain-containing protein [Mesorhizobium sp. VK25A]
MTKSNTAQLHDRLRACRQPFDKVPLVDVAGLIDGSDPGSVAKEIRWALANVGFMYIKNHGVPGELVEKTFVQARSFFEQPVEEKMKLHISNSGVALRGYIEYFGENTDPSKTKDLKEGFDIGPERPTIEGPFFGPNQWPATLPGFRMTVFTYHEAMKKLSIKLLSGIALSLDLPMDFFEPRMKRPITIQRLLHYPPQTGFVDDKMIGIGAHTDYGNLTILAQDSVGGLQVMNREGIWVEGNPIPGAFVINIGDLIQKLTNDRYIANLHRVINASGCGRYSLPFFVDADYDAVFAPLESCVSADSPARYQPICCGAHKFARFVQSFPHLQKTSGPR